MLEKLIIWLCHLEYKRFGKPIFLTGKDYPKYLLYTEDENVYKRMDNFMMED